MSIGVNTNSMSINAQMNLRLNQSSQSDVMQRLSTGLRINSSKDDAAGLAISTRLTAQINGQQQAMRNTNNAISYAQTAEGALNSIMDRLQEARQLAVQAASDDNTARDRKNINDDVQALLKEVNRISLGTEFNGKRLLDGSTFGEVFQVGANQGNTIELKGVDARGSQMGVSRLESNFAAGTGGPITRAVMESNGFQIQAGTLTIAIERSGGMGPPANLELEIDLSDYTNLGMQGRIDAGGTLEPPKYDSLEQVVNAINNAIDSAIKGVYQNTGTTFTDHTDDAAYNREVLSTANIRAQVVTNEAGEYGITFTGAFDAKFNVDGELNVAHTNANGDFKGVGDNDIKLDWGGTGTSSNQVQVGNISVGSRYEASLAISTLDGAIDQVSLMRSELGATMRQFASALDNLNIAFENFSTSRGRIMDTDFAFETSQMTKSQILVQVGVSMTVQANAQPQTVLSLLQ